MKKYLFIIIATLVVLSLFGCTQKNGVPSMEIISITVGDSSSFAIDAKAVCGLGE